MTTPYQQGRAAFKEYVACDFADWTDNPFKSFSSEYESFERGWNKEEVAMERAMVKDGMT